MKRPSIFAFNLLLAMAAAAALALAAGGGPITGGALLEAVRRSWWAGLSVGMAVAVGATVGGKPALPVHRCLLVQGGIVLGSILGGLVGGLFPEEVARVDRAFHSLLERRGIVIGAGVGTVLSTAWEIFRVYRMRRRAEQETRRLPART